jgi:MarR family transcriptional repressor of emrRAB
MKARTVNLVAALATAITDRVEGSASVAAGRSGSAAALLAAVKAEPGLSVQELSTALGIGGSGTVRLIDRLEADGLVRRRVGRDARSVAVHLSAKGQRAAQSVLDERHRSVALVLDGLRPAEQQQFGRLVEKVLAGLALDNESASRICRLCDVQACPEQRCPIERTLK